MERLPDNLKTLREGFGLTQQQLADHLGINRVLIAFYEGGNRKPPLAALDALSELFCVSIADLLTAPVSVPAIGASLRQVGPLSDTSLRGVAFFFRIVRNYERMQRLAAHSTSA